MDKKSQKKFREADKYRDKIQYLKVELSECRGHHDNHIIDRIIKKERKLFKIEDKYGTYSYKRPRNKED